MQMETDMRIRGSGSPAMFPVERQSLLTATTVKTTYTLVRILLVDDQFDVRRVLLDQVGHHDAADTRANAYYAYLTIARVLEWPNISTAFIVRCHGKTNIQINLGHVIALCSGRGVVPAPVLADAIQVWSHCSSEASLREEIYRDRRVPTVSK
jgi:hypothetical protein